MLDKGKGDGFNTLRAFTFAVNPQYAVQARAAAPSPPPAPSQIVT